MTNQPIREALALAAGEAIERYYDETPPDFASDDIRNEMIADAALSILSTALAERDARIAELEVLLGEIRRCADYVGEGQTTHEREMRAEELERFCKNHIARAKLKESSRG